MPAVFTMNILAIGAHPDDIELGCGGTLLQAVKQGHNVYMYGLTRGSASGDPDKRGSELQNSAKIIGAKNLFIDNFEDTKLQVNSDLINHIEFVMNKVNADIVYTHSMIDTHHDHRAIAEATREAGRFVPNILAYEMPMTKDFKPQVFYDISAVIDDKTKLINVFYSQKDKSFVKSSAVKGLAQYRALQSRLGASVTCVESFEVVKLALDKDFKLLSMRTENTGLNHSAEYCTIESVHIKEQYPVLY
jgi:LmbE family N-acetylglucosaminyl deacetylase